MKKAFPKLVLASFLSGMTLLLLTPKFSLPVAAHSGATGIVKERMDGMKAIASAAKTISKLDWNALETSRAELKRSAGVLQKHAGEMVALFPKGSIKGPSEATQDIWDRPEEFAALARKLETAAGSLLTLSSTAMSKSDIAPAFGDVAATCKACHGDFRKKK